MNRLSDLSKFIESETFSFLDESIRDGVIKKLRDTVDDLCNQWGLTDNKSEDNYEDNWMPRRPDLNLGLIPIDMPSNYEIKWILGDDIRSIIPVVRANGKYGLFRPTFQSSEMGASVRDFLSTKNPFKYDDVRICVPRLGWGECNGYLAVCQNGKWSILAIDIDSHPLKMVDNCFSFDEARREMETILGQPSPYPWMTFDMFDENDETLWNSDNILPQPRGGYTRSASVPFKVTFPDGTVFDAKKAVKTFIDALLKIGLDKVQQVGITHAGYNLVSDNARPKVGVSTWQEQVNGKYIYTKLSNNAKMADLVKINNYYGLGLRVE